MAVRDVPTDAPLRRDVRMLGDLLGQVLVEQEDDSLLADVERVRALARAARGGASHDDLAAAVAGLPLERQASVLRAFALYFQLANVAEQQHRIRRRRAYAAEERVVPESLDDSFARIPAGEVPERVSLQLVLTAHPTEAARRTVLASHLRIAALLAELDDAPYRRDAIEGELAAEITALWQTDEVRSHRPRVVDEIRNGHWFFEQSLIDAAEQLLADYRRHLPDAPAPLRFGTWIGGDADGNPNAGADTIREALERARTLLRHRYRDEVRELAAAIGISSLLTPVDPELLAVDRARRARAAGLRLGDRRPERRRAVPAEALVHVAAARRGRVRVGRRPRRRSGAPRSQPPRPSRRADRRRRARRAAPPGRDLRPAPREARPARACARDGRAHPRPARRRGCRTRAARRRRRSTR